MTPWEAVKAFCASCAAAFLSWFAVAVLLEKLIPGFVTPFIDLADMGLIAILATFIVVTMAVPIATGVRKIGLVAIVLAASGIASAVLWFSLNGFGTLDAVLFLAIAITVLLSIYAILYAPRAE